MPWYYVEAGAQKGPLDDDKFIALVTGGVIRAETLVWREGMKDWQPYGVVAGVQSAGAASVPLGPGEAACGECGRAVPAAETVEIAGRRICASCKPRVVQRMIEGTSSGAAGLDPEELLADLRARGGYTIDVGSVVSRSFDVVKNNLWPSVGVRLLMWIIEVASGVVPILGVFISWVLTGMINGGTFRYFLLKVRGEGSVLNDAFAGFQAPRMKELMLAGMVVGAPAMLINLFSLGVNAVTLFQTRALESDAAAGAMPMIFIALIGFILLALVFLILWMPSLVILADEPIHFWKALELSRRLVMQRFLSWILVYLTFFALALVGMLALCVGIFFVMPMMSVMFAMIWDDIRKQAAEVKQARLAASA